MTDALITAALRARPDLDVVDATMASGAVWLQAACSPLCLCAETRAAQETCEQNAHRLGLRSSDLRRSSAVRGRRRFRDLDLVFEFAAWTLRPPARDWCDTARNCVSVGFGYSAYDPVSRFPNEAQCEFRTRGAALRRCAAEWMRRRAGSQRTPYCVRLRRAGIWLLDEAGALEAAEGAVEPLDTLSSAKHFAVMAGEAALDAALHEAGLPPGVRSMLLDAPETPLAGPSLVEALYLARAGRSQLRALAARRLAGARGGQPIATLRQLLWEDAGLLADTALWAIGMIDLEAQRDIALSVAQAMALEEPTRIRPSLLCATSLGEAPALDELVTALSAPETRSQLRPSSLAWLERQIDVNA